MAKFPFTNFFDVNGNGKMDFSEELLAMKVFEDALPEDEAASYDDLDSDWDGLGDDSLDDGLEDEFSEDTGLEHTDSLIDPTLGLYSSDFADDLNDEDHGIWNDPDEEDLRDDPQKEPEETPVAYLTFSVASREERYAKQGIRREDYPNQRTYDAACELADLRKGEGYVPQNSTRKKEMEKRQFILSGGCAAARYLTVSRGFLYAQAVKENFQLPIEVPDEDEQPVTSLEDLFLDLAEEDPALAVRVWAWIVIEFGPYSQYMDGTWAPFNGILYLTDRFPPEFQDLVLEELCQNGAFRRGLLEESPEFPDVGGYIAYTLEHDREEQGTVLLKSALKNPQGKGTKYEEMVTKITYHIQDQRNPEPWEAMERAIFPVLEDFPDKRTQRLLPQWKKEVADRLQWLRPRPAPVRQSTYSDPLAETDTTVYTFCGVMFPRWQRVYHYRTDDETLAVGDKVLVPGRDGPTEAEVVSIEKCLRKTAPYPVDRAKFVVGRCEKRKPE